MYILDVTKIPPEYIIYIVNATTGSATTRAPWNATDHVVALSQNNDQDSIPPEGRASKGGGSSRSASSGRNSITIINIIVITIMIILASSLRIGHTSSYRCVSAARATSVFYL